MGKCCRAAYARSLILFFSSSLPVMMAACTSPVERAAEAFELGDHRLAQQILEEVVASEPRHLPARHLLADVYDSTAAVDGALDNGRVLTNLEPRPRNTFRLMRLTAQVGDFFAVRELFEVWPQDSVSAFLRRTARERGDTTLVHLPHFQRGLGAGDYLAARTLATIHEHMGDDDYSATRDIAIDIQLVSEVAPALLPIVRQPAEDYLAALPEPRGLTRGLYVMNLARHDRAVGRLLAGIGEYDRALSTYRGLEMLAASLYETGDYDGLELMSAMGERVDLDARFEGRAEAHARCRELQSRFPEAYEDHRPFACIQVGA